MARVQRKLPADKVAQVRDLLRRRISTKLVAHYTGVSIETVRKIRTCAPPYDHHRAKPIPPLRKAPKALDADTVIHIRQMRANGMTHTAIAREVGRSTSTIASVLNRQGAYARPIGVDPSLIVLDADEARYAVCSDTLVEGEWPPHSPIRDLIENSVAETIREMLIGESIDSERARALIEYFERHANAQDAQRLVKFLTTPK